MVVCLREGVLLMGKPSRLSKQGNELTPHRENHVIPSALEYFQLIVCRAGAAVETSNQTLCKLFVSAKHPQER